MKKYLYTLLIIAGIVAMPFIASALSVSWDRYQVGAERPLFPTDKILVGASATTTQATLEVQGSFAVATSTLGCAQFGVGGLLSSTGTNCGSGGGGSSPATSTNPIMFTYAVSTSTTATSTFAGPLAISGYTLATSSLLEVCQSPDVCQYEIARTSTSSDVTINTALLAASAANTGVYIKGYSTTSPYVIHDVIKLPSNVLLRGDGADMTVIKADVGYLPATTCPTGAGNVCMLIALTNPISNSTVTGITIDGNVQNAKSGLSNSNAPNRLVDIRHATNFTFSNNIVRNGINWSVFVSNSHIVHLEDNQVYGGYSSTYDQNDGIHTRSSDNVYIRGNYCDTTIGGLSGGDDCIVTGSSFAESDQDDFNIVITDNIVKSRSRGILIFQEGNFNTRNVIVENNRVTQSWASGILVQKIGNSNFGQLQDITINGNNVTNFGTGGSFPGDGIAIESSSAIPVTFYKNISISSNTIASSTIQGDSSGVSAKGKGSGLVISNNNMRNLVGTRGIQVGTASAPNTDVVISGNRIDLSLGTTTDTLGIFGFGLSRSVISNNEIYGNLVGTSNGIYIAAANTAGNDNQGVARAEPSNNNTISGNSIYTFDNGYIEANAGQLPTSNQFLNNSYTSVTIPYSIIGTNSQFIGLNGLNYGIGSSTPTKLLSVGTANAGTFAISTSTAGCAQFSPFGELFSATCGSFTNTLANGGTATTTFYNGGVIFSDASKLTQSAAAANFFWNETNKRLGLGTSSPVGDFQIEKASPNLVLNETPGNNTGTVAFYDGSLIKAYLQYISPTYALAAPRPGNLEIATPSGSTGSIDIRPNDTSTLYVRSNGGVGFSTTSPVFPIDSFSSSGPQLALSAGVGITQWTARNAGGNLYFATTTGATTSTTTVSALSLVGGMLGLNKNVPAAGIDIIAYGSGGVQSLAARSNPGGTGAGGTNYNGIIFDNLNGSNFKNQFSLQANGTEKWSLGNDINGAGANNFYLYQDVGNRVPLYVDANGFINTVSGGVIGFSSDASGPQSGSLDTAISRVSAGKLGIGTGATGSVAGTLIAANIGVGTSSPYATLGVLNTAGQDSFAIGSSTGYTFKIDKLGRAYFGYYADCNGTNNALGITTGQLLCDSLVSDQRLKKDIKPFTDGLEVVTAVQPQSYFYKDNSLPGLATGDTSIQYGIIAQDLQKVAPDLVTKTIPSSYTPDGTLTYNRDAVIQILWNSVRQLAQKDGVTLKRSAEENWQDILIGLLIIGFVYQQIQIKRLKK